MIPTYKAGWERVFSEDVVQKFNELPLGVMKADLWRYMVLSKEGGIYLDSDVEMVLKISEWKELAHSEHCDVIIGLENNVHFCQWAMISLLPNHNLFKHIVSFILMNLDNPIDKSNPNFVHNTTGPGIFTAAILDFYKFSRSSYAEDFLSSLRADKKKNLEIRNSGVCFVDEDSFKKKYLSNRYLSQWGKEMRKGGTGTGEEFPSWIEEINNYKKEE